MQPYRLAVVGLEHYHVTGWVESLEQFSDVIEIVALYDPDPAMGARRAPSHHDPILSPVLSPKYHDLPFTTDLDALIREHRPDLALITMPNKTMPVVVEKLADAGVHLLIDKPGARTAPEALPALRAIERNGVKAAIGLNRRYGRAWQDARAMIEAGRIGRLMSTEAIFITSSTKVRDPKNQIFNPDLMGGGVLHWLGVHDLDLLLWLSGEPIVELQALSGTLGEGEVTVEDVMSMSVRYASGAIGTVHYAYALPRPGNDGYVAFRGTGGSLRIQSNGTLSWFGPGTRTDPQTAETRTYELASVPGYGPLALAAISDWLKAIETDRQPLAPYGIAVEALRVIDAAYRSAQSGQRVRLD